MLFTKCHLGDEIKKYVKGGRGHIWETEEVETVFGG